MYITLIPQRSDEALVIEKTSGDRLRINGELFNFNPLQDGDILAEIDRFGFPTIPIVPCKWILGPVKKIDGELRLTIILPHGPQPEAWQLDPAPITLTDDGPVDLPADTWRTVEVVDVPGGVNVVTTVYRWHHKPELATEFIVDRMTVEEVEAPGGVNIVTTTYHGRDEPAVESEFIATRIDVEEVEVDGGVNIVTTTLVGRRDPEVTTEFIADRTMTEERIVDGGKIILTTTYHGRHEPVVDASFVPNPAEEPANVEP